jgi:hypothetical protein
LAPAVPEDVVITVTSAIRRNKTTPRSAMLRMFIRAAFRAGYRPRKIGAILGENECRTVKQQSQTCVFLNVLRF